MKYHDGSPIALGDIGSVLVGPDTFEKARVVMLGDTYDHLDIDERFVAWVNAEKLLEASSVVVEWLGPILSVTMTRDMHRSATTCFLPRMSGSGEMPNTAFETDAVQRCALHGAAQRDR